MGPNSVPKDPAKQRTKSKGKTNTQAHVHPKKPIFTGFFRDGVSRIDLVLVINDDGDGKVEMLRVNFLSNIVKTGLDIELESGVMEKNKKLIFVKIHAPASVIIEYGDYFNTRRYFKESHVDFVNAKYEFMGMRNERELIKALRTQDANPPYYSNLERSVIVYKILLMLPFGEYDNYFGLNRLLKNRIILDVYPLHDGPYFYLQDQDACKINCRQVLYGTWLNFCNLIGRQPLSLINEYMGQRVAFYFAFLDYYLKELFFIAIFSIIFTMWAKNDRDHFGANLKTCHPPDALNSHVCGVCLNSDWCPTRPTSDYCLKAKVVHTTHSYPVLMLCMLIGLCSIILTVLWERRSIYLYWLWEINKNIARKTTRPEYKISKTFTGRLYVLRPFFLLIYNIIFYGLYFIIICVITLTIMYYKHWILYATLGLYPYKNFYIILAIIAALYFCFGTIMQYINKTLAATLTNYENPRTFVEYENSYVWKFFVFSFLCYLSLLFYYTFFMLFAQIIPSYDHEPTLIDKILFMNCGIFGCGDELLINLMVILLLKDIIFKIPSWFALLKTDYKLGGSANSNVPCWEREYELSPINDNFLDAKYLSLVLQIALGTFFISAFPLAPVFIFIINIWDISYNARYMLTSCRRPLVLNSSGLGAWQNIILVVGYAVPLFNILCMAWNSEFVERAFYTYVLETENSTIYTHYQKKYPTYFSFTTTMNKLQSCSYPSMYEEYLPLNRYWEPKRWKWLMTFYLEHIFIILGVLLRWLTLRYLTKELKETSHCEHEIMHQYRVSKDEKRCPYDGQSVIKEESPNDKQCISEEPPNDYNGAFTGRTFRDGIRQIDLIVVVKEQEDPTSITMRNNCFVNIIKMGLEIEYEAGVMTNHKHLLFFKLHCPDEVLCKFSDVLSVRCVESNRASHIMSRQEREWINLIRNDYQGSMRYSNADRSLIVYTILLNLSFGERQNHIGIERLIKREIMVDVYALHDGPYFISEARKATSVNGRQILFYNWAGYRNMFNRQPLNLIHEYFGPKIAMFFAFYGIYNLFLFVAAIGAIITTLLSLLMNDKYTSLIETVNNNAHPYISLFCSVKEFLCYIAPLKDFRIQYPLNILVDNKFTPFFSTFILLWGFIFISYWSRIEKNIRHIWEVRHKEYIEQLKRPEFEHEHTKLEKSQITGISTFKRKGGERRKVYALYFGVVLLCLVHSYITIKFNNTMYNKRGGSRFGGRVPTKMKIMTISLILFIIGVFILDRFNKKIACYIVTSENHKTYQKCKWSLARHLFILSFTAPFLVLYYFGFHWNFYAQFFYDEDMRASNFQDVTICGLTSCLHELEIAFTLILLTKLPVFGDLSLYLRGTDYKQDPKIIQRVPCWEREYLLKPFNEIDLMDKMKLLVIQFLLIIMFGFSSPMIIVIVLLFNIYDFRRYAQLNLLHYRRPLLLKDNSFNIWSKILKRLVYLAIIVHTVSLICNTDFIEKHLNEQRHTTEPGIEGYIHPRSFRKIKTGAPVNFYYMHGFLQYSGSGDVDYYKTVLTFCEYRSYQYRYIFIFEIAMIALFVMIQYIFSNDWKSKQFPKENMKE